MMPAIDSARSGIDAFADKMQAAADNTANVVTNRHKARNAAMVDSPDQGVRVTLSTDSSAGYPVEETNEHGETEITESSNVDLSREFTASVVARQGVVSNVKSLQTADEMLGSLLDVVG